MIISAICILSCIKSILNSVNTTHALRSLLRWVGCTAQLCGLIQFYIKAPVSWHGSDPWHHGECSPAVEGPWLAPASLLHPLSVWYGCHVLSRPPHCHGKVQHWPWHSGCCLGLMPRTIPRGDFCKVNQITGSKLYVTLLYPIPRYTVFTIVFLLCSLRDWTNGETKIADFVQSAYFIIAHRIIPSIKKRMEGSPVTFSLIQGSKQLTQ